MLENNTAVGIFNTHLQAETAVLELQKQGMDIKKLSIVGKDEHTDERVVGYYNTGDRMKYWGANGAVWGGLWGMLFGAGFFWVPGVGPLLVAGPLVAMIVGAFEGAAVVGGLSAVGAGLYSMGIPKDSILQYETAIKTGQYVLIYHGAMDEVEKTNQIIGTISPVQAAMYLQAQTVGI